LFASQVHHTIARRVLKADPELSFTSATTSGRIHEEARIRAWQNNALERADKIRHGRGAERQSVRRRFSRK